ncbi:hypothetical protein [Arthrobacter sp. ISL-28]|uniref:hypothetical protein n=1 Tax=Arthrobacter sp. ISL-28 TaxID=2819108 RepID=UPI001BE943DF|nr:hypothetical protein [Arthrobacter sp. ISL-28]MBT2523270.1 hypothetical protein [Arthrobacter sp. ISL-28]
MNPTPAPSPVVAQPVQVWCPGCHRNKPATDFRKDHDSFPPRDSRSNCQGCRRARKQTRRETAMVHGVCEMPGCLSPVVAKFKCDLHYGLDRKHVANKRARRSIQRRADAVAHDAALASA